MFAQAGVKDLKVVISKTREFIAAKGTVSSTSSQVLGRFLEAMVETARELKRRWGRVCGD